MEHLSFPKLNDWMEIVILNMFTLLLLSNSFMKGEENAASYMDFVTIHQRKAPCNVRAPLWQVAPGVVSTHHGRGNRLKSVQKD